MLCPVGRVAGGQGDVDAVRWWSVRRQYKTHAFPVFDPKNVANTTRKRHHCGVY